jgi:hypothetical protein
LAEKILCFGRLGQITIWHWQGITICFSFAETYHHRLRSVFKFFAKVGTAGSYETLVTLIEVKVTIQHNVP